MKRLTTTMLVTLPLLVLLALFGARHYAVASGSPPPVTVVQPVSDVFDDDKQEPDLNLLAETTGFLIGKNLNAPELNFDIETVIRGIRNASAGKESPMSEEEYQRAMGQLQEMAFDQMATDNLRTAEEFLAKNRKEKGIVTLEEGKLQYRIDQKGTGSEVAAEDTPMVHYTGKYADGTEFGSSREGEPIALPLSQAVTGFRQGVAGMKEGERRTLYVHPELGYGKSGPLMPNALLIFDVEVLKAQAAEPGDAEKMPASETIEDSDD